MNAALQNNAKRRGSAMTSAIVLTVVITGLVVVGLSTSLQRSFSASKLSNRMRAMSIAEAGANAAYARLTKDFELAKDPTNFPKTPFGDGAYDVDVKLAAANLAVIYSKGMYKNADGEVILEVRRYSDAAGVPPAIGGYLYTILSGGDMTWGGNGVTDVGSDGRIHTNAKFLMNGTVIMQGGDISACTEIDSVGTAEIRGDTFAPVYSRKSPGNVVGTVTADAVATVGIPEIDFTPYYNWALKNGQVYNGNLLIATGSVKPNGGVMWVNGDLKLTTNDPIEGCFIATGNIDIAGHCNHSKVGYLPALMSRDGDIDISGNGNYNGLIYCKTGRFEKTGGGSIHGSIICQGEFVRNGGSDIYVYENSTPVPPGTVTNSGDIVSVEAWQK